MGGGTECAKLAGPAGMGSIPAWAGEPYLGVQIQRGDAGSIPAWAGEPPRVRRSIGTAAVIRVYPRVGGGTRNEDRIRGTEPGRSIPAWAGEPSSPIGLEVTSDQQPWRMWSIPAWAGEPGQPNSQASAASAEGLSPRGRGNPGPMDDSFPDMQGVYPRVGGGTARKEIRYLDPVGSIPAWAGEPLAPGLGQLSRSGLSPRGRGNRHQDQGGGP